MSIDMLLVLFAFVCTSANKGVWSVYADDGVTGATSILHQQVERRTQTGVLTDGSLFRQAIVTGTPTNAPIVAPPITSSPTALPVVPTPKTPSPTAAPIVPAPTTSTPTAAPIVTTPTTPLPTAAPVPSTPTAAFPTLLPGTTAAPVVNTTITINATTTPASPTSTNATAPVAPLPVNGNRPSKIPTTAPIRYCDESDRRRLSMSSKMKVEKGKGTQTGKGKGTQREANKNHHVDGDEDVYDPCIELDTSGKSMGKMDMMKRSEGKGKGKGKGKGIEAGVGIGKGKGIEAGVGIGKGKGIEVGKGKGNGEISDDLFRPPAMIPSSKHTFTPTIVPSSNIIEAEYGNQTCKTVNGTFGTVSGSSLSQYVATFSYELETIPGSTSQTVENLILPALDQAFGDYVVPNVLHSSVLDSCSAVTSLQQKWEFISEMINERLPNQTKAYAQAEAENIWEANEQEKELQQSSSNKKAVGFSVAPPDTIDSNRQCSFKSKPENPCFVMLGLMTIYIETGMIERRHLQGANYNDTQVYQDSVEATMKQFMSDTDNYRNVSQLIARLSYVPPEPEEQPMPEGEPTVEVKQPPQEKSTDDRINSKLWLGILAGLGGILLLIAAVGVVILSNKRSSEHVSLTQQHAETNADTPATGSYVSPKMRQ